MEQFLLDAITFCNNVFIHFDNIHQYHERGTQAEEKLCFFYNFILKPFENHEFQQKKIRSIGQAVCKIINRLYFCSFTL